MIAFTYGRPASIAEAVRMLAGSPHSRLLGGGTCLTDLMKQGVESPSTVIDISRVAELRRIDVLPSGALRVGATATLSQVARYEGVKAAWPLLHETIVDGLTPQLRNAATFAGNVMQRPRCIYFREPGFKCNKRVPTSGCAARDGVHYAHAVFGGADAALCVAVHPSDLCVALTAFDARVHIVAPDGVQRELPLEELHRLPGSDPTGETTLGRNELIVALDVPAQSARRGAYVKGSEGFTLASCASLFEVRDGIIAAARVVLGGVAHKPWRAMAVESALLGRAPTSGVFRDAASVATDGVTTDSQTAFRLPLVRNVVKLSLERAMASTPGVSA